MSGKRVELAGGAAFCGPSQGEETAEPCAFAPISAFEPRPYLPGRGPWTQALGPRARIYIYALCRYRKNVCKIGGLEKSSKLFKKR